RKVMIPETDDHIGAAAEPGVDGALAEQQAERRIVRRCGYAPDRVAGIDVLQVDRRAAPLDVRADRLAQKDTNVAVLDVARCVALAAARHQILPRSFGHHDRRVAATLEPPLER